MNKEKFDKVWKIMLLTVLILGMIFMFWQFSQIDKEGIACRTQPFVWGAKQMTLRPNVDHMFCSCTVSGEDFLKPYSFTENQENPEPN